MTTVSLSYDDARQRRMAQDDIDLLNQQLVRDEYGNVDLEDLPQDASIVGIGLYDEDGRVVLSDDIDDALTQGASCFLVQSALGFCNLWVDDGSGGNGFDDQIELHFEQ